MSIVDYAKIKEVESNRLVVSKNLVHQVYSLDWLFESMKKRSKVNLNGFVGVVNGINIESGCAKKWNIYLSTEQGTKEVFVHAS